MTQTGNRKLIEVAIPLEAINAASAREKSIRHEHPSTLHLLVLGNSPRDSLQNAWVQFLRIDGVELSDDIIDVEEIDGSLASMLRRMDEKLRAHIRTRVDLKTADTESRTASYPLSALREIVRNALMHWVYEGTNAPVRVT